MAASVQCRQEEMSFGDSKKKEKGDDLSLFVDFNGANLNIDLHQKPDQFQEISDSESEIIIIHGHGPAADDLLKSENTTDYDWLLSPPRNSAPSLEMEEQKSLTGQHLISNGQSTSPKSKLQNPSSDSISTTKSAPKLPSSSIKSSNVSTIRRPSPSRKPPSTTRPTIPSTTKPSRSSTPTSRPTIPATKPLPPSKRSTTPTARSSTPTARPSITTTSKSTSRSSTPNSRPSITTTSKSTTSRSSTPTQRPGPTTITRSNSVTKSRAPPNLKKTLPERPASASRGRPEAVKPIPKRTSSSPSRGPVSNGVKTGVIRNRGFTNGNDDVNPVLMGTKMVERVVNMRKLAPPREDRVSNQNDTSGKLSVSQDNSGFGRSLSKKSFDMALRHLDIRRSMPGNMRASITKVPASSVYSVRSESTKNRTICSTSDSPLTTSSSGSSDH